MKACSGGQEGRREEAEIRRPARQEAEKEGDAKGEEGKSQYQCN